MQITASLKEIESVASYLLETIPSSAIIFLSGDLASGKTTLTKSIAKLRGFDGEVTSPTFSLQHCYGEDTYHYDLYRIDFDEFVSIGLFEELDREGWHIVEWGSDRLKSALLAMGYICYEVSISTPEPSTRVYEIKRLDE